VSRVLGNPGQDVGEPSLRIDVVHFCRDDDAVHNGGALAAAIRRDVMMPGVWDARSGFAIRSIRFVGRCHWSLPISFMTVVTI